MRTLGTQAMTLGQVYLMGLSQLEIWYSNSATHSIPTYTKGIIIGMCVSCVV
jgi:hypothetical protein